MGGIKQSEFREREREKMKGEEDQGRSLFGISLTDRPKWQQFLICSSGFFFGYLVNGICEVGLYNLFFVYSFHYLRFVCIYIYGQVLKVFYFFININ